MVCCCANLGGNDRKVRKDAERAMFGDVYDSAKAFERPKYGLYSACSLQHDELDQRF